jgi:hypothetical protein
MEPLVLTDQSKFPSDDYIFSIIGKNGEHWKDLLKKISEKFPASAGEWRFYKDGGNWLYKMVHKKKTLYWIGVLKDTFRITFYFGSKAESMISESNIPDELKDQYLTGKRYGKIRAVTFIVSDHSAVENAVTIAEIKSRF